MSADQYTRLIADLEREKYDIEAELERLDKRRVYLIFRKMEVKQAIYEMERIS